jgi:hypothetical protein
MNTVSRPLKLTPSRRLTTLYTFCAESGCTDGLVPLPCLRLEVARFMGRRTGRDQRVRESECVPSSRSFEQALLHCYTTFLSNGVRAAVLENVLRIAPVKAPQTLAVLICTQGVRNG